MGVKKGSNGPENLLNQLKRYWGRFWHFFWEEDTFLSWAVNIVVAFILIKWVIYPGLGIMLQTSHPVVAVISQSMEHDGSFDQWWQGQQGWYLENNITKEEFLGYTMKNGFNRGDIIVLYGIGNKAEVGDIIVYSSYIRNEPIIHRIVDVRKSGDRYYYSTKGDRNDVSFPFESSIADDDVIGKAILRLPYLGWIKITFVCGIDGVTGKQSFINCMRG